MFVRGFSVRNNSLTHGRWRCKLGKIPKMNYLKIKREHNKRIFKTIMYGIESTRGKIDKFQVLEIFVLVVTKSYGVF